MDDASEFPERHIVLAPLGHQCLERAAAVRVLVRIAGAGSVEPDRSFAGLDVGHLLRLDEEKLRPRIV